MVGGQPCWLLYRSARTGCNAGNAALLPRAFADHGSEVRLAESACDAVDGCSTGTRVPRSGRRSKLSRFGGASHAVNYDNRLDMAKSIFPVPGVDTAGQVVVRRQLRRQTCWDFSRSCHHACSVIRGSEGGPMLRTVCAPSR